MGAQIDIEKLGEEVNKGFEEMCSRFKGKTYYGISDKLFLRDSLYSRTTIGFDSSKFKEYVAHVGLDLDLDAECVPQEVADTEGVPFRAEVRSRSEDPRKYLAIKWISGGHSFRYFAHYRTNDKRYANQGIHGVNTDIIWVKSAKEQAGAGINLGVS
jgi:hypothetical protein